MSGGIISWLSFTLQSIAILVLFAYFYQVGFLIHSGWIHGLKIVAVAVVAQAVLGMGKQLSPDGPRLAITILTAAIV